MLRIKRVKCVLQNYDKTILEEFNTNDLRYSLILI